MGPRLLDGPGCLCGFLLPATSHGDPVLLDPVESAQLPLTSTMLALSLGTKEPCALPRGASKVI